MRKFFTKAKKMCGLLLTCSILVSSMTFPTLAEISLSYDDVNVSQKMFSKTYMYNGEEKTVIVYNTENGTSKLTGDVVFTNGSFTEEGYEKHEELNEFTLKHLDGYIELPFTIQDIYMIDYDNEENMLSSYYNLLFLTEYGNLYSFNDIGYSEDIYCIGYSVSKVDDFFYLTEYGDLYTIFDSSNNLLSQVKDFRVIKQEIVDKTKDKFPFVPDGRESLRVLEANLCVTFEDDSTKYYKVENSDCNQIYPVIIDGEEETSDYYALGLKTTYAITNNDLSIKYDDNEYLITDEVLNDSYVQTGTKNYKVYNYSDGDNLNIDFILSDYNKVCLVNKTLKDDGSVCKIYLKNNEFIAKGKDDKEYIINLVRKYGSSFKAESIEILDYDGNLISNNNLDAKYLNITNNETEGTSSWTGYLYNENAEKFIFKMKGCIFNLNTGGYNQYINFSTKTATYNHANNYLDYGSKTIGNDEISDLFTETSDTVTYLLNDSIRNTLFNNMGYNYFSPATDKYYDLEIVYDKLNDELTITTTNKSTNTMYIGASGQKKGTFDIYNSDIYIYSINVYDSNMYGGGAAIEYYDIIKSANNSSNQDTELVYYGEDNLFGKTYHIADEINVPENNNSIDSNYIKVNSIENESISYFISNNNEFVILKDNENSYIEKNTNKIKINSKGEYLTSDGNIYDKNNVLLFSNAINLYDNMYQSLDNKYYTYTNSSDAREFLLDYASDINVSTYIVDRTDYSITYNITHNEDIISLIGPNGEEVNGDYTFEKNGCYIFNGLNKYNEPFKKIILVRNLKEKTLKIPTISVADNTIYFKPGENVEGYKIEYSMDNTIWNDYTQQIEYSSPIYYRATTDDNCSYTYKAEINSNGKLNITNVTEKLLQANHFVGYGYIDNNYLYYPNESAVEYNGSHIKAINGYIYSDNFGDYIYIQDNYLMISFYENFNRPEKITKESDTRNIVEILFDGIYSYLISDTGNIEKINANKQYIDTTSGTVTLTDWEEKWLYDGVTNVTPLGDVVTDDGIINYCYNQNLGIQLEDLEYYVKNSAGVYTKVTPNIISTKVIVDGYTALDDEGHIYLYDSTYTTGGALGAMVTDNTVHTESLSKLDYNINKTQWTNDKILLSIDSYIDVDYTLNALYFRYELVDSNNISYSFGENEGINNSVYLNKNGNYTIKVYFTNEYSDRLLYEENISISNIDKVNPIITTSSNSYGVVFGGQDVAGTGENTNSAISGIKKTYYSFDNLSFSEVTKPIKYDGNLSSEIETANNIKTSNNIIYVYTEDKAGNVSNTKAFDISLEIYEKYTYTNGSTSVEFYADNDTDYLDNRYNYSYNNGTNNQGHEFTVTEDSIVNIKAEKTDLGNTVSTNRDLDVKVIKTEKPNIGDLLNETVTVNASDEIDNAVFDKLYIKIDNGSYTEYDNASEIINVPYGEHTVYAYQTVKANINGENINISSDISTKVIQNEKTLEIHSDILYKNGKSVLTFYADNDSDRTDSKYSYFYKEKDVVTYVNGYKVETTEDKVYTVKVTYTDNGYSISKEIDINVAVVKTKNPVIGNLTDGNVTVSIGQINNAVFDKLYIKIDNGSYIEYTETSKTISVPYGKHTIYAYQTVKDTVSGLNTIFNSETSSKEFDYTSSTDDNNKETSTNPENPKTPTVPNETTIPGIPDETPTVPSETPADKDIPNEPETPTTNDNTRVITYIVIGTVSIIPVIFLKRKDEEK